MRGGAESATPPPVLLSSEWSKGQEVRGGAYPDTPSLSQEVREPELRVRTDQATPLVAPEVEPELTGRTESATPPLAPEVRESELRGRTDPATPPGTPEVKFEPEVIQSATSVFTVGKMVSDAERPEIQGSGQGKQSPAHFPRDTPTAQFRVHSDWATPASTSPRPPQHAHAHSDRAMHSPARPLPQQHGHAHPDGARLSSKPRPLGEARPVLQGHAHSDVVTPTPTWSLPLYVGPALSP